MAIKVCSLSCGIATMFILASLFTSLFIEKVSVSQDFKNSLNDKQLKTYQEIVKHRQTLYLHGLLIGFIVSLVVIFGLRIHGSRLTTFCSVLAISFVVCYFYYILSPKQKYMVRELENQEQIDKWLKIYRLMQFRYHLGFALGLVGVAVFSQSFC